MKISIIIGAYNSEDTILESIDSLLNQTFQDFEIIICDDGSTDNTPQIIRDLSNKYPEKIRPLFNEKNKGLNFTLNKCLRVAKGEYVARMDADDVSIPERLEIQNGFLDIHHEYAFVSSNMVYFDETGDWGTSKVKEKPEKKDFPKNSPFPHAPAMVRRSNFLSVGGYGEGLFLNRVEDYHLWIKMYARGYYGYNIQQPLYKMRDDHKAFKRRTFLNRINEMCIRFYAVKELRLASWNLLFTFRPLIVGLLPAKVYEKLHKKRLANID